MTDKIRQEESAKLFYPNNYCKSHNGYSCDTCRKELKKNIDTRKGE